MFLSRRQACLLRVAVLQAMSSSSNNGSLWEVLSWSKTSDSACSHRSRHGSPTDCRAAFPLCCIVSHCKCHAVHGQAAAQASLCLDLCPT